MNKNERLAALGLQAYAKVRQLFAATDHADAVTQATMFQKLLTRIVEGLRAQEQKIVGGGNQGNLECG